MVPCQYNDGKPVRTRHHQEWDKYVRKFTGGLTVYQPAVGQWVHKDQVYHERMIPVRIACTENQLRLIARFTMRHYKQLAVFAYVVSEKVFIFKADDKTRQDQDVADPDKYGEHDGHRVPSEG